MLVGIARLTTIERMWKDEVWGHGSVVRAFAYVASRIVLMLGLHPLKEGL